MTAPAGDIGDPTKRRVHVLVEARELVLAGLLAALAGMVDVIGYLHLNGLFVSYMSGNSTQLAAALGQGNLAAAAIITKLVVLFVLGAAAGQVLAGFTGEWHMSWVLAAVAILLTIAGLSTTAGALRPGAGRSADPAFARLAVAGSGGAVVRSDRRSNRRQCGVRADRASGNLDFRGPGCVSPGLLGGYTPTGLTASTIKAGTRDSPVLGQSRDVDPFIR